MNKALFICATLAVGATVAQEVQPANVATNAAKYKSVKEAVGGFIFEPLPADAKYVTIVDKREVKDNAPADFAHKLASIMHIACRVGEAKDGDIVLTLVDKGDSLVYLDKAEAVVVAEGDEEATRHKLMAALIRIIGIKEDKFGPQVMGTAMSQAKAMGIGQVRRTTYKTACEEGWAPPPANEFQKAVAERIAAKKAASDATNAPAPPPAK